MYAPSLLALLVSATPLLAYNISGSNYCVGPYALCAGAPCTAIAGTQNALCTCKLYNGLNSAGSTCEQRVNNLLSTYSIAQLFPSSSQPELYSFPCTGSNAGDYAECIDAPCTTKGGVTMCTCPIKSAPNHYLGPTCPTSASQTAALCKSLRSSGSSTTAPGTGQGSLGAEAIQAQFYGVAPAMPTCSAPGS